MNKNILYVYSYWVIIIIKIITLGISIYNIGSDNSNLTHSYWSIGSTKNVKENNSNCTITREMGDMGTKIKVSRACGWYVMSTLGIDTRLRRWVSFIDPMAPIGTIGSHCRPVLWIDINGFQCFDHCLIPKVISGAPLGLLFLVRCREAKRRANVEANDQRACSWHVQLSTPSQLTAGDLFVHWVQTKFGLNVPYYGGVWYIHDWVRVMWLIVLTHRAWNWRNLEYSFAVRHQFSHPYKQIDKIRLFKY